MVILDPGANAPLFPGWGTVPRALSCRVPALSAICARWHPERGARPALHRLTATNLPPGPYHRGNSCCTFSWVPAPCQNALTDLVPAPFVTPRGGIELR